MASISKRGNAWRAQVRRKGHPPLNETFATKQEAQRWAREKEHEIDKGKHTPAGLRLTVGSIIGRYQGEMGQVGKTKRLTIKRLQDHFADMRLDEFGNQAVLNYASKRELEGAGPVTLLTDLSYLRVALRYGGVLVEAADATAVAIAKLDMACDLLDHTGRISTAKRRERRPTTAELEKIEAWALRRSNRASVPFWDLVLFAVATSMRLGEFTGVGGLRWADINWQDRTVLLRDRKHPEGTKGNDEVVPLLCGIFTWRGMSVDPLAIIKAQSPKSGRVFPFNETTVSDLFHQACVASGISDLRFHDLRHEAISRMFEYGLEIQEVAIVSGHQDWKNLKRYTHLKPEQLHKKMVSHK